MKVFDVAVIGGGASGLFLSSLLGAKYKVVLFEANERVGKKILMSGNGKCNLLNQKIDHRMYNNPEYIKKIAERISVEKILNIFMSMGLLCKNIDGRIYPYSEVGNTVLNVFRENIKDTTLVSNTKIVSIDNQDNFILTASNEKKYFAKYVVLATGSPASLGIDSLELYAKLGHSFVEFKPALTYIKTTKSKIAGLSGIRVKASLISDNYSENGEILFKDDGISGIIAFNMASRISRSNSQIIYIDFMPDYQLYEVRELIKKIGLEGIFHRRIAEAITKNYSPSEYIEGIKKFKLEVLGFGPMENAQVATGGLSLDEFNSDLSSKIIEGAYATGEVLDIDGECGGFNLYWAWASSIIVAESLENKLKSTVY